MNKPEQTGMLNGKQKLEKSSGCCHSKHTKNCCIATGVFGALFLLLGVIILLMGKGLLEKAILKSMALTPGSDRLASNCKISRLFVWNITDVLRKLCFRRGLSNRKLF